MQNPRVKSDLICYLPEHIPEVWDSAKGHLQRALDRGSRYTLSDIYDGLITSRMQLWVSFNWETRSIEAALVTSIQDGYCLLLACGGQNMREWAQWLEIVEKWAREHGCEELRIYGRRGWAKVLGFEIEYTKMVRKL